jgi:hypothetical protein
MRREDRRRQGGEEGAGRQSESGAGGCEGSADPTRERHDRLACLGAECETGPDLPLLRACPSEWRAVPTRHLEEPVAVAVGADRAPRVT